MSAPYCPCCGKLELKTIGPIPPGWRFAGAELSEPLPPTDLIRCEGCHLQFRWPAPTVEELAVLYRQGRNEKWDYDRSVRTDWKLAANILGNRDQPARVLDVGCWDGLFFSCLGDGWEPTGVEINPEAAASATKRGVKIIGATLDDVIGYEDKFDAVTAFDVVEHMHNPADLLDRMAALVRTGGMMVVGTGNTQSSSWRLMGSRYWYCTNPEHISFIGLDWCQWYSRGRNLQLEEPIRYSHTPSRTTANVIKQTTLNLTYRFVPSLIRRLRKAGVGGTHASRHEAWSDAPPNWMTAKDHLLAVFVKSPAR